MRMGLRWLPPMAASTLCVVVLGGGGQAGADSPMFLGTAAHTSVTEALTLPEELLPVSCFQCRGGIFATPALVEGVLYFGSSRGTLYALDLATGRTRWEFNAAFDLRSSPAVSQTSVYVGCADGRLYCLDRTTGRPQWEVWTGDGVPGSPCLAEGTVYIGSLSGKLYAVDAADGSVLWTFDARGPIVSSPAVNEGLVYFGGGEGGVYCVSTGDGSLMWKLDTEDKVDASPVVADGVVYVGSWAGTMYALDALTGALVWTYPTARRPIHSPAAVGPNDVFFGGVDGRLYAVDRKEGTTRWRFRASDPIYGAPLLVGDRLYFGDSAGVLWCISAVDGRELARVRTTPPDAARWRDGDEDEDLNGSDWYGWYYRNDRAIHSSPVPSGDTLYVTSESGHVFALRDPAVALLTDPKLPVTKALLGIHLARALELPAPPVWGKWPPVWDGERAEPSKEYARFLASIGAIGGWLPPGGGEPLAALREPSPGEWSRPLDRFGVAAVLYKLFFEPNALGVAPISLTPAPLTDTPEFPGWCANVPPIIVGAGLMTAPQGRFDGYAPVVQADLAPIMEAARALAGAH